MSRNTAVSFKSLPVTTPLRITSGYGNREHPVTGDDSSFHNGVDVGAPAGTSILAVSDGEVLEVINNSICGTGVRLRHFNTSGQEYRTVYCHMIAGSPTTANIRTGTQIKAGNIIGKVGSTGRSTGPHLHFILEVRSGTGFISSDPTVALRGTQRQPPTTVGSSQAPTTATGTDITPYIASLESFHPNIQYELTRRRVAAETANTYMPFVRLTSLVKVYGKDLSGGSENDNEFRAIFPTLGVDGQREVSFEDIYYPRDGRSIVGYATSLVDPATRLPLVVGQSETDQQNIPIPGITSISAERSTAGPMGVRGGLLRATINIKVYSVGQLNTMLKYFIRPANRVVLEVGRTSSSHYEQNLTVGKPVAGQTLFTKFNWNRSLEQINQEDKLDQIIKGQTGQREFIQKYVYNNFGDYEIFVGYVVNFKIKYTKENIYDIELLVHSVQQFEITTKNTGVQTTGDTPVPNTQKSIELVDYFNLKSYWRENSFVSLLRQASDTTAPLFPEYSDHIIPLGGQGADPGSGGVTSTGFLVSWEFFINVILNNEEYGILSLFQQEETADALNLLRSSIPKPIKKYTSGPPTDLNSSEVAWNAALRSTDPNTMIIYNQSAQGTELSADTVLVDIASLVATQGLSDDDRNNLKKTAVVPTVKDKIINSTVGSFSETSSGVSNLTQGVWINSNAIVDAFSSTDTVSMAITKLLNSMNTAVQGYWNLQLLSSEETSGMHIIDAGMSKPISTEIRIQEDILLTDSINNFEQQLANFTKGGIAGSAEAKPAYMYVFNRKSQTLTGGSTTSLTGDTLENGQVVEGEVGSELLDISVDSSLPQVIAVQAIAGVGGVGNAGTLSAIDINELKQITVYDTYASASVNGPRTPPGQPAPSTQDILTRLNLSTNETRSLEIYNSLINAAATERDKGKTISQYIEEQKTIALSEWVAAQTNPSVVTDAQKSAQTTIIQQDIDRIRAVVSDQLETNRGGMLGLLREYGGVFGMAIDLIEYDITKMTAKLQVNKEETEVHPFNSSNLTKTIVDLTLPGIGGIQLFQSFMVERIPNILQRGFYVVTKIVHEFATDKGWITKIQGRFRYKPETTTKRVAGESAADTSTPTGAPVSGAVTPTTPRPVPPPSTPSVTLTATQLQRLSPAERQSLEQLRQAKATIIREYNGTVATTEIDRQIALLEAKARG